MTQENIRQVEVYRINGRIVVANSLEGAIVTWKEFMLPSQPDIMNIERITSDTYQCPNSINAVMFGDICGDNKEIDELIARQCEEIEKLRYDLEKANTYISDLQSGDDKKMWLPTVEQIRSVYAAAGILSSMNEKTDSDVLMSLWADLKELHKAYAPKAEVSTASYVKAI